jgi:hypothetical protein
LEGLAEAVDEVEVTPCADGLIESFTLGDRFEAKVCEAVDAFDVAGSCALDGAASTIAWLRNFCRISSAEAARVVARARRLRNLPATRSAWLEGTLSSDQVQAVVANVSDATVGMFAEDEESLVPRLAPLSVAQCAIAMRYWRLGAEARLDPPERPEPPSSLYLSRLMEGRGDLKGNLDAESAEVLAVALRQAASDDVEGEPARTPAHRRAERSSTSLGGSSPIETLPPHLAIAPTSTWWSTSRSSPGASGRPAGPGSSTVPTWMPPPSSASSAMPECTGWSPPGARSSSISGG